MSNTFHKTKMIDRSISPEERERRFKQFIVSEYLKYGSVDAVFSKNRYDLPISYPHVHRLIKEWGIVKAAGPNSKLSEAICFTVLLSDNKIPVEALYKMLPPSFKTSLATMHRIVHNIKEGMIRRYGTALVISSAESDNKILVGKDISTPRLYLGKPFGSTSLPMGYSKKSEDAKDSILRVLQQEVFTKEAISQTMPKDIIPKNPKPFMYLDVADVRVAVYQIKLPRYISDSSKFSSHKLSNFRFVNPKNIIQETNGKERIRLGLKEISKGYLDYLEKIISNTFEKPAVFKSEVNVQLAEIAFEFVR